MYYRVCNSPKKIRKEPLRKKSLKFQYQTKRKERKLKSRNDKKGLLKSSKRKKSLQKAKEEMEFQKHRTEEAAKGSTKTIKINKLKIQKKNKYDDKNPKRNNTKMKRRRRNLILYKEMISYSPYNRVCFLYIYYLSCIKPSMPSN